MTLLRVVLIDDNDDVREAMCAVLTHHLPDLVDIAAYHPADYDQIDWSGCQVALIDLMMPVRSGESILAELRDNHPAVYRVAWTARAEHERDAVAESGLADAVVAKPGFTEIVALLARPRP